MTKKEPHYVPRWAVRVEKDGKVIFIDPEGWKAYKRSYGGREGDIILKDKVKDRSRHEEKYYYGVVVKAVAEKMDIGRKEAHEFMAGMFLTVEKKSPTGFRYTKVLSTTELGDKRYHKYIFDECLPWAALPTKDTGLAEDSGLGLYIPKPNEVDYEDVL